MAEVIDGDTIRLDDATRVRLVQIDAPELRGGECYGRKATAELRRLLPPGTEVRLQADPRLDDRDRYDRELRYVHKGSMNVNLALVRRGAASVWFFEGDRGRYARRLLSAAERARATGVGLWGACPATELDPLRGLDARKPPPPPPPPPPAPLPAQPQNCHPSYKGECLDPSISDYDCAGGSGNGPGYTGPVRVVGPDDYGLDADGDGYACESS